MVNLVKKKIKNILKQNGIAPEKIVQGISHYSLRLAIPQQGLSELVERLRKIVPDISNQESSTKESFNDYWEFKRRSLQSFQCCLMLKSLENYPKSNLIVIDIGDSAGTHMLYLKELTKGRYEIDPMGVNLDSRAIEKIKARGIKAILCRAEELDLDGKEADLFTSFQMVEHLHNPAIFFYRLSKKSNCKKLVITVPYLRRSRVGLYHTRTSTNKQIYAEDEHIFELSPEDWSLLIRHSGWKITYSKIYYQYPKRLPIISSLLALFWKKFDFEGFWGAILEKDTTISDCYQDWKE